MKSGRFAHAIKGMLRRTTDSVLSTSPRSALQIATGVSSLAAGAAYLESKRREYDRANVILSTTPRMREFEANLKQKFRETYPEVADAHFYFDALLESIENNDLVTTKETFIKLAEFGIELTAEIRDGVIAFAANHGKLAVSDLLIEEFGEAAVMRNTVLKKMLAASAEDKAVMGRILEQHFQSPGQIKQDGMVAAVAAVQADVVADNLEYRVPSIFGFDDVAELLSAAKNREQETEIMRQLTAKFKHTEVLDARDTSSEGFKQKCTAALQSMKDHAVATGEIVVGTLILSGNHFSMVHLKVTPNDHQCADADIILFDCKGSSPTVFATEYYNYADLPFKVFHEAEAKVDLHIMEDLLLRNKVGCSLFVLHMYEKLMSFDELFAANQQYEYAGQAHAIFKYARDHRTHEFPYGVGGLSDVNDASDYSYDRVHSAHLFTVPALLSMGRQSYDKGPAEVVHYRDQYEKREDGRYSHVASQEEELLVVASWSGLRYMRNPAPVETKDAHRERQRLQEYDNPADLSGVRSVNQVIDAAADNKNSTTGKGEVIVKTSNGLIDNSAYESGNRLLRTSQQFALFGKSQSQTMKTMIPAPKSPRDEVIVQEMFTGKTF